MHHTLVVISIGGRHSRIYEDSNVDYVIEATEIDPEDKDMYQVLRQIEPTNYTVDIIRIEKEREEEREGRSQMLVGRVYL